VVGRVIAGTFAVGTPQPARWRPPPPSSMHGDLSPSAQSIACLSDSPVLAAGIEGQQHNRCLPWTDVLRHGCAGTAAGGAGPTQPSSPVLTALLGPTRDRRSSVYSL